MPMREENKRQVRRLYMRSAFAAFILYLLVAGLFASPKLPQLSIPGLFIVGGLISLITVAMIFKIRWLVLLINRPLHLYIGRNNYLLGWIFIFAIVLSLAWWNTQPGVMTAQPSTSPAELVTGTSGPTPKGDLTVSKQEGAQRANPEALDPNAEGKRIAQEEFDMRYKQLTERYANHTKGKGFVTNTEILEAKFEVEKKWTASNNRAFYSLVMWILFLVYIPFAVWDELGTAFYKVERKWREKSEAISKPVFYEAARKILGSTIPPLAGAAVAAGSAVTAKHGGFWREVLGEALGSTFSSWFFRRR